MQQGSSSVLGISSFCKKAYQLSTEEAGVTPLYVVGLYCPAPPCKRGCLDAKTLISAGASLNTEMI